MPGGHEHRASSSLGASLYSGAKCRRRRAGAIALRAVIEHVNKRACIQSALGDSTRGGTDEERASQPTMFHEIEYR